MATMSAQGTLPVAGGDINAAPLTDTINHIMTTWNGKNADSSNVDTTSADAIMTLDVAQTKTTNLTFNGGNLAINDDDLLVFGDGTDYWFNYDATNTQFELNSTNVDGAGTDGVVFSVDDGTDDVTFTGVGTFTGGITSTGALSVDSTTDTTSGTTGSIHTDGGVGIAKALYVGTTSRLVGAVTVDGAVSIDDTTDTSSGTTGSLHTDGGLGVAKDVYVGDDLLLASANVINWAAGDITLTHSAAKLTFGGDGAVEIDFNNHEMTNVDINSGTVDATSFTAGNTAITSNTITQATGAALNIALSAAAGDDFTVDGTKLVVEGDTGNVGIGTATPGRHLHIQESTEATVSAELSTTGTENAFFFIRTDSDGTQRSGVFGIDYSDNVFRINHGTSFDGANNGLAIDSSGNVGIGTASPDGPLHVHTATAGTVAPIANADDFTVENSGNGGISILTPDANIANVCFGSPSDSDYAQLIGYYNGGDPQLRMDFAGNARYYFYNDGLMLINDSANANMTVGLTMNGAANSDEIFACKGSNVAHGMTDQTETDTYGHIIPADQANGGWRLRSYTGSTIATIIEGFSTTDITTKTTAGRSNVEIIAGKKTAATVGDCGSDANMVGIRNQAAGTRFLFDAEGSGHADVEWTTYAAEDDFALIRDVEATLVPDTFGEAVKYKEDDLVRLGLFGKGSIRMENGKKRGMMNWTKMLMLHHGTLHKAYLELKNAHDRIGQLENRLLALEA